MCDYLLHFRHSPPVWESGRVPIKRDHPQVQKGLRGACEGGGELGPVEATGVDHASLWRALGADWQTLPRLVAPGPPPPPEGAWVGRTPPHFPPHSSTMAVARRAYDGGEVGGQVNGDGRERG